MSKDPTNPSVDLRITQLLGEGIVRTTWPRVHPRGDLPLTERLNPMAENGLHEVCACQAPAQ
jgi:hypothetical protein